ncbi:MAG: metallophosphoesterase [Vicinamibacterales bacterium]|nr:metallophosphoesterase [Vicinamibacterales bacterium]
MTLWATSDLHVAYDENRDAVDEMQQRPGDWLILAGDTGETLAHLEYVLDRVTDRFERVVWTPGNHDLWTPRGWPSGARGLAHYERLVAACQRRGVLTPEDPFALWPGASVPTRIAPIFTLYDYSFRPDTVPHHRAVEWAADEGIRCADETLLAPDPYASREAWCHARVEATAARLSATPAGSRLVLVGHFPLRRDLAVLPLIPRFSIWCGTRLTEQWHTDFPVDVVVSGHLHMRSTRWRNGVRFEEVSLGYPKQWDVPRGADAYLRQILPEPAIRAEGWGRDDTVVRHR